MDILIDTNIIMDHLESREAEADNADYIITRNINDFRNSPIPVILPKDFLKIIEEQQKLK